MIKSIIIGKFIFPLTDELAQIMIAQGMEVREHRHIKGTRVFGNKAELEAQAFRDRTGFDK